MTKTTNSNYSTIKRTIPKFLIMVSNLKSLGKLSKTMFIEYFLKS